MRSRIVLSLLAASLALWSGNSHLRATQAVTTPSAHDIDRAGMDRSVAPGDDFFMFANGAWYKHAAIPPDRSSTGIWAELTEVATQRTRELIDGAVARGAADGSDERKIADYYSSYMDEAAIEEKGAAPLAGFLKTIGAISDRHALTEWVCGNLRTDVDPLNATNLYTDHLFGLWIAQDLNDPGRYTPYILQGGLGMPDRDYYVDDSPEMQRIRTAYRAHIAAVLKLAGIAEADAKAERIFALEHRIAEKHGTRTQSSDVLKANNPWTPDEFERHAPGLDWPACLQAAGLQGAPTFIVWQPDAIAGIAALAGAEPLDTWRDYLTYHLIDHYSGMLPKAFVEERFAFYGKVLSGTPQLRERWKRGVDWTNEALGDAVGRLYAGRFFAPEAKARLQTVVRNIIASFERRVDALTWMNPKTKANAKAKLDTLIVGIGYPDKWRDYAKLEVVRGEPLMNLWRAELFDYQSNRDKLGRPVDRSEWAMTPQTVNALNLPAMNALNFPAAILQPPFYDPEAAPALIYGAIGSVIGHEISHSFDDQGSQFDATGKLANWWTEEDFAHFKEASAKLVAQYNAYMPLPGLQVNGQLTLSENIADVAGLSAAYDAYRASRASGLGAVAGTAAVPERQKARGKGASAAAVSDDQKFFISYAQAWRSKDREALLRQLIVTDGHAPDQYRADTVRNLDAWYTAFNVRRGQRLFLAPADRVRVW